MLLATRCFGFSRKYNKMRYTPPMTGQQLKEARLRVGWTQQDAARRLGLTQAYLSMLERGRRAASARVARRAQSTLHLPPTVLPVRPQLTAEASAARPVLDFQRALGALGYPGFAYLRQRQKRNPAEVLFVALNQPDLDARVREALPWLALTFPDLAWDWLLRQCKTHDRQNRLAFVVNLAAEVAQHRSLLEVQRALREVETRLEPSRLANEDTLCHDAMTGAERRWLRHHRSTPAKHWNLLTDLGADHLAWAS